MTGRVFSSIGGGEGTGEAAISGVGCAIIVCGFGGVGDGDFLAVGNIVVGSDRMGELLGGLFLLKLEVLDKVGEVALLNTLVLETLPPPNRSSSSSSNCLLDRNVAEERSDVVLTLLLYSPLLLPFAPPNLETSMSPNILPLVFEFVVRRGVIGVLLLVSRGELGLELRDRGSFEVGELVRLLLLVFVGVNNGSSEAETSTALSGSTIEEMFENRMYENTSFAIQ